MSPKEIDEAYRYWRFRIIYTLIIGYAAFYLVRQNLQIAAPKMLSDLGYRNAQIGMAFTVFSLVYGLGKFISGAICDRTNARWFMTIGLVGAALCSACIGCAGLWSSVISPLYLIIFCYSLNGVFQSAGWPPVSRLMTQWYSPTQLGTRWGIVNSSHQLGSVAILWLGAVITDHLGWRYAFFIPSILALLLAAFVFERLRDNPQSLGLPSVEEKEGLVNLSGHEDSEQITFRELFMEHILPNKALWYVCIANFFVYIVRMGFFNWLPTYLYHAKGMNLMEASWMNMGLELMGAVGGLAAGWLSDKVFGGRRNMTAFFFMIALCLSLIMFATLQNPSRLMSLCTFFLLGFFVYGPQTLSGLAGAEFGSKRAAAAGAGITGTFGYLGAAISGYGVGKIVDEWGWNSAFLFFIICAAAGAFFFMLNWNRTCQQHKVKA